MDKVILEIGTEEIPARFLSGLEKEAVDLFSTFLTEKAAFTDLKVESSVTPRRTLIVSHLPEIQPVCEEQVSGPASRVAFDVDGNPTKAAYGFAKTVGIDVKDLFRIQTEKGEYIAGMKKRGGGLTLDILAEMFPKIVSSFSFAKRMRWGSGSFAYARPIRWILALFGDQVIPFTIGGVRSGRLTYGHRVMGAGPFEVPNADQYEQIITKKGCIDLQSHQRRNIIVKQGEADAEKIHGKVIWKESLLDEVQGLVEKAVPLIGDIDPSFLELPREVLLTSMETHQKSFGIEDQNGKLLPHFLTVLNLIPKDINIVKKGWERVLRARLEDARFFWKTDLASSFDHWLNILDSVIFLAPLGSMGDKTRRVSQLCATIAEAVGHDSKEAARAGRVSKADLVSAMVGEFDTLQGIMGGIYAKKMGESESVAAALSEQYLPAGPDSAVPNTELGSILSIADKIDTLVGCFGLGMIPTGAADPYALRRCALGIIRIILDRGYRFDLSALFTQARELYGDCKWKMNLSEAGQRLQEFMAGRMRNYLLLNGFDKPLVDAIMAVQPEDFCFVWQRAEALSVLEKEADFTALTQTFKRVANIIRKQSTPLTGKWNIDLLREDAEKVLADRLIELFTTFESHWAKHAVPALFRDLAGIRPVVDALFDSVMVISEDADLRINRLNLLKSLALRMERLADFAALQV